MSLVSYSCFWCALKLVERIRVAPCVISPSHSCHVLLWLSINISLQESMLISGFARVVEVLEEEFAPYLDAAVSHLLRVLNAESMAKPMEEGEIDDYDAFMSR